jgi:hypothetical protein
VATGDVHDRCRGSQTTGPTCRLREAADAPGLERERRRQLDEQRPEPRPKACDLVEESLERLARASERAVVGDDLRDLHREPERRRHRRGPALVGRGGVWTIEGAVDLGGVQPGGVSLQL